MFRIYKSKSGITRGDQEKIMSNFHESWFLTLKFPRCVTQFYRISKGKKIFILSRFSKGRVTNLKDPGSFLKKVCPQSPFGFFWNSPTIISYVLVSLVIVRILTERWKFKFLRQDQEVCMLWPILRSTRDNFF